MVPEGNVKCSIYSFNLTYYNLIKWKKKFKKTLKKNRDAAQENWASTYLLRSNGDSNQWY